MRAVIEAIINLYETDLVVRKCHLTRDEYIYFYLIAEGCTHPEIMDYFNCKKDKLYRLRASIIRKMKANNLNHALFKYARLLKIIKSQDSENPE